MYSERPDKQLIAGLYNHAQKLSDIVVFSCLRYKELYDILEYFVRKEIYEIESGKANLVANIRPISE